MTEEVRLAKYEAAEVTRPYAESEDAKSVDDKASLLSLAPSNASSSSDGPLSRVSTPKMGTFEEIAESVIHAIILPSYKEDLDTLRETLSVLASHILAKSSYDVSVLPQWRERLLFPRIVLTLQSRSTLPSSNATLMHRPPATL